MKSRSGILVITLLAAGCASSPTPMSSSAQQTITVDARDKMGVSLANASCELANDKGTWTVTTPGSALIDRSLSPLSVSCVKNDMTGLVVLPPGMQSISCKNGEVCGYPTLATVVMIGLKPVAHIAKVKVTGYGAPPRDETMSPAQKRLLAMRASKADAYRALVEQLHGIRVSGTTTVGDMVIKNDTFRVYLDAYVHGAQVLNNMAQPDGVYETEMELTLGDDFYTKMMPSSDCNIQGGVGPGCAYPNRAFYISQ